jgi:ABC-type multidrug transport system fused ATPase/permease subunit
VGSTGAGKSTLADVILGVLAPDLGVVFVGGHAPADNVLRWPGAMAYVPQDIAVINGTVRENVAMGLPEDLVHDERAWEALERARLADFLLSMREGLDTVVGEHGVKFSGGQRQRLGIARALYTRPRLLVMDEATSALDAETEAAVTDTFSSMSGEVTLVVIAHRLATIRHSDQIAYLNEGRLMAVGSFDEVRAKVPDFERQAELLGL